MKRSEMRRDFGFIGGDFMVNSFITQLLLEHFNAWLGIDLQINLFEQALFMIHQQVINDIR